MRLLIALAALVILAGIAMAPRCSPGDGGLYVGGAILVAGCPR